HAQLQAQKEHEQQQAHVA
ncbi:hypothetical protein D046_2785B, partial [Vibrio parahaemolyticus V-223/04]